MNNEIAILIVGTGENSIQFKVGEPAYWSHELKDQKRRVIEAITQEVRKTDYLGNNTVTREVYLGWDKKDGRDAEDVNILFEVSVENCVVIYKAALEVVNE